MSLLENYVEDKVVQEAKKLGVKSTKLNALGARGKPDRIFWIPGGRPLIIEFKRPGGKKSPNDKLRKLQKYEAKQLKKIGYNITSCDSIKAGVNLVRSAIMEAERLHDGRSEISVRARSSRAVSRPRTG